MKDNPWISSTFDIILLTLAVLALLSVCSCTSYNPYTGRYEPDPGKTMVAVGAAAFTGSVIYNETNRDYHRPPNHYHYHNPGPPPRR